MSGSEVTSIIPQLFGRSPIGPRRAIRRHISQSPMEHNHDGTNVDENGEPTRHSNEYTPIGTELSVVANLNIEGVSDQSTPDGASTTVANQQQEGFTKPMDIPPRARTRKHVDHTYPQQRYADTVSNHQLSYAILTAASPKPCYPTNVTQIREPPNLDHVQFRKGNPIIADRYPDQIKGRLDFLKEIMPGIMIIRATPVRTSDKMMPFTKEEKITMDMNTCLRNFSAKWHLPFMDATMPDIPAYFQTGDMELSPEGITYDANRVYMSLRQITPTHGKEEVAYILDDIAEIQKQHDMYSGQCNDITVNSNTKSKSTESRASEDRGNNSGIFADERFWIINSQNRKKYFHIWFVGSKIVKADLCRLHSATSNVEIIYAPTLISGQHQLEFMTYVVNRIHAYNREFLGMQILQPRYTKTTVATFPI